MQYIIDFIYLLQNDKVYEKLGVSHLCTLSITHYLGNNSFNLESNFQIWNNTYRLFTILLYGHNQRFRKRKSKTKKKYIYTQFSYHFGSLMNGICWHLLCWDSLRIPISYFKVCLIYSLNFSPLFCFSF